MVGRVRMINRLHPLPIAQQAQALGIGRSSVYYSRRRKYEDPNWDNCIRHLRRQEPELTRDELCKRLNDGGVYVSLYRVNRVLRAERPALGPDGDAWGRYTLHTVTRC